MSVINFGSSVSLMEFKNLVKTVGQDVTIIGQGQPGIGKSSVLKMLAKEMPEYEPAYIDCTLLDLGDFALPYTVDAAGVGKVTKFAPNARFKLQADKPVVVMLDEIGKAMKSVKNVLLTLMLEHRIGDVYLPKGSIVFGTTNLASDGVGDSLEAHARNRGCVVHIRNPYDDEWIDWALNNDIAPEIIAFVKHFPQVLASYTDEGQRDNPYIMQPTRAGQTAFVTGRSLEMASDIAKQRAILGDNVTIAALSGTLGEAAARDMQAFFTVVDKLPTWDVVIKDPENTKVPEDTIAKCIFVFSALVKVQKDTFASFMKYLQRLDPEWQALFAKSIIKSDKQTMAVSNKEFKDWALKNQYLF
jgi:hypothetical protein